MTRPESICMQDFCGRDGPGASGTCVECERAESIPEAHRCEACRGSGIEGCECGCSRTYACSECDGAGRRKGQAATTSGEERQTTTGTEAR